MTKLGHLSGEAGYRKISITHHHGLRACSTCIRLTEAPDQSAFSVHGPTMQPQTASALTEIPTSATKPAAADQQDKTPVVITAMAVAGYPSPEAIPEEQGQRRGRQHPQQHAPGGPPPLNFTLHGKRTGIATFVVFTFFDSLVLPVGLYFGLWYGFGPGSPKDQPLSASVVMTIVTAIIGGASIWELLQRAWRLGRKGSRCRVFGAAWWHFDWFEWWFIVCWVLIIIEVSVAFIPEIPNRRLMAMPVSTVLLIFGTVSLALDILRYFSIPAPLRISSTRRGAQLRPGIYPLIEDICAVDGAGNTAFRESLNRRYSDSAVFRAMLQRLGVFWALGAECCAVATLALVLGLDDGLDDYAYAIGWALPWVWAAPWAGVTIFYVRRELDKERRVWALELDSYRIV
ncbi:hypothetical protein MCOR27_005040 [Pyricularia oryzae]|uniref:Uncharacterized protein n=2 Tax=Pyricularia TaxID=48558 RepID=A0ABQ8NPC6_PYRGI|nr:hypothetical protein MCOR01_005597 [Pyricularia oryzae]KAI6300149.1 hypothetical protein MCOR33_004041 [Pyricularia grisea]KAH9434803.1 hypothetical protein MCOR02_003766 [Pyricularia oryzae]KAI6253682.1 hypothetical protein MCOR19_009774 [Pyricularia oryzae]KAI6265763.1 hypothetical protein MCOR26_010554 [Pyricularia oryzae]